MSRIRAEELKTGPLGSGTQVFGSTNNAQLVAPARKESRKSQLAQLGDAFASQGTADKVKDAVLAEDLMLADMISKKEANRIQQTLSDPTKARLSWEELVEDGLYDEEAYNQIGNASVRRQAIHEARAFAKVTHGAAQKQARRQYDMGIHQSHFQQFIATDDFLGESPEVQAERVNEYRLLWESNGYSEAEIAQLVLDTQEGLIDSKNHNTDLADTFLGLKDEHGQHIWGESFQRQMQALKEKTIQHTEVQRYERYNEMRPEFEDLLARKALTWEYFQPFMEEGWLTEGDANHWMGRQNKVDKEKEDLWPVIVAMREGRADKFSNAKREKAFDHFYGDLSEESRIAMRSNFEATNGFLMESTIRTLQMAPLQAQGSNTNTPIYKAQRAKLNALRQAGASDLLFRSDKVPEATRFKFALEEGGFTEKEAETLHHQWLNNKDNIKNLKVSHEIIKKVQTDFKADAGGRNHVMMVTRKLVESGQYNSEQAFELAKKGYGNAKTGLAEEGGIMGFGAKPRAFIDAAKLRGEDPAKVDRNASHYLSKVAERADEDPENLEFREMTDGNFYVTNRDGTIIPNDHGGVYTLHVNDLFATGAGSIDQDYMDQQLQQVKDKQDARAERSKTAGGRLWNSVTGWFN